MLRSPFPSSRMGNPCTHWFLSQTQIRQVKQVTQPVELSCFDKLRNASHIVKFSSHLCVCDFVLVILPTSALKVLMHLGLGGSTRGERIRASFCCWQ